MYGPTILFNKIMKTWHISNEDAMKIIDSDSNSDEKLRIILRIATDLYALFIEDNVVRNWLYEPKKELEGQVPIILIKSGKLENLMKIKEYTAYLSGR